MTEQNQGLDIPELVAVIDGTVKDIQDYVENNNLTDNQLQQILETEKASKQRKTVIEFLEKSLEDREVSNTIELAKEEVDRIGSIVRELEDFEQFHEAADTEEIDTETLLELVGGTVKQLKSYIKEHELGEEQLQELLDAEKTVKDRKTAKQVLQKEIQRYHVEEDIKQAEEDVEKLREDLETIESKTDKDSEPIEEDEEIDEIAEALDEVSKEIEGEDSDDSDIDEIAEEIEEDEETVESEDDNSEEVEDEKDDESEEDSELEEKKEVLEDLDIEMSDEELENITLDHLKELRDEKQRREQLIDELTEEDFDEEDLKSATTEDLEKIKESISSEEETDEEDEEEEEKDEDEIREEAEEDLEMLMGAVKSQENNENSKDRFKDLKEFQSKIKNVLSRGNDEEEGEEETESKGMTKENVLDILGQYEEMGDKEAAIKTAHIMKGYLEYKENIDRELTYKELADNLEGTDGESLETVLDFFRKMNVDQYTGDMENIDVERTIEAAKQTVEELG